MDTLLTKQRCADYSRFNSGLGLQILLFLYSKADNDGYADVMQKDIAEHLDKSRQDIHVGIKRLKEAGLVTVVRKKDRANCHAYKIV